ncbi:MAG: hypothetical protein KIT16_04570 [Rhodospirillaceae bacterium]|nr:hypothetical protein [Rhodospirillaceae bacterium]
MRMKSLTLSLALLSSGLIAAHDAAAQGHWELLGSRQVGFGVDRDVVSGAGQGQFTVIRLCVRNNAVHFRHVEVEFANGQRQNVVFNARLRPGQCSPNLDLAGDARRISRVMLAYNSVPNFRGQAVVSVYGLHRAMGPGPGPGPGSAGWERMGTHQVGFRVDRDTFFLQGEGRFRALRLCVARNGVHFRDVTVVFGNGERQDLPVQRFIGPGQCTPVLDLRGNARRIRQVVMLYNAQHNFRGQAAVTLYGLH